MISQKLANLVLDSNIGGFFEHVEVTVEDGKFEHKLSLCEDFKPHKSEYFTRNLLMIFSNYIVQIYSSKKGRTNRRDTLDGIHQERKC